MTHAEFRAAYSPKVVAEPKQDAGLFVWTGDGRYPRANALAVYSSARIANKAADRMNAAGEHGGMVVVRPLDREQAEKVLPRDAQCVKLGINGRTFTQTPDGQWHLLGDDGRYWQEIATDPRS